MTKRAQAPLGAPVWIDLSSKDVDVSRAFYGELFGWTSEVGGPEYGGYTTFSLDGVPVAGCMGHDGSTGAPEAWAVYLASEDCAATEAAAVANGATVMAPTMDVGDLGRMAFVFDPGGALVGIWEPKAHPGFGVLEEPGAPSWFELFTRDHAASVAFYETVFGWHTASVNDTDDFRYTTLGEGDDQAAGIMDATAFLPPEAPAHWSVYVDVADADAALARVAELGGTPQGEVQETPYGRLAVAQDPNGAAFKLRQP